MDELKALSRAADELELLVIDALCAVNDSFEAYDFTRNRATHLVYTALHAKYAVARKKYLAAKMKAD